jgi:hypothetical protein
MIRNLIKIKFQNQLNFIILQNESNNFVEAEKLKFKY